MMDKEQEKRSNTASAVTMEEPESTVLEDEEEYVPIDLCANIDYTDEPPPGFFDWWEDDRNPFSETIIPPPPVVIILLPLKENTPISPIVPANLPAKGPERYFVPIASVASSMTLR